MSYIPRKKRENFMEGFGPIVDTKTGQNVVSQFSEVNTRQPKPKETTPEGFGTITDKKGRDVTSMFSANPPGFFKRLFASIKARKNKK